MENKIKIIGALAFVILASFCTMILASCGKAKESVISSEIVTQQVVETAENIKSSETTEVNTVTMKSDEMVDETFTEEITTEETTLSDTEAPVIVAPSNIYVSRKSTVRYKSYITVTDNLDNEPSIDNGKTWYICDAASWTWMYDEYPLCMMTMSFAQEMSDKHGGLFIYDHEAYPEISEITLWTTEDYYNNIRLQ